MQWNLKKYNYFLSICILEWVQNINQFGDIKSDMVSNHLGPLLLTWFNFNPSMDK